MNTILHYHAKMVRYKISKSMVENKDRMKKSKNKKGRSRFNCIDCGLDTGKMYEHYYVNDQLWFDVIGDFNVMCCIGCFEQRLGRQLTPNDFPKVTINDPKYEPKSQRLMNRIYGQNNLTA